MRFESFLSSVIILYRRCLLLSHDGCPQQLLKQGEGEAPKARSTKYTWRDMQVLGRKLKKADDGAAQILIRRFLR